MSIAFDKVLDARGMNCPMPLVNGQLPRLPLPNPPVC